jgi:hypothetical protein
MRRDYEKHSGQDKKLLSHSVIPSQEVERFAINGIADKMVNMAPAIKKTCWHRHQYPNSSTNENSTSVARLVSQLWAWRPPQSDERKDNAAIIRIKSDEPGTFVCMSFGGSNIILANKRRKAAAAPKRYFIKAAVCSREKSTAFSRLIVTNFVPGGSSCTRIVAGLGGLELGGFQLDRVMKIYKSTIRNARNKKTKAVTRNFVENLGEWDRDIA